MTTKPAANIPKPKDVGEDRAEAGDRKLNLLVIEDDEQILEAISEYFSRAGYTVQTAGDGLSGVQSALNDRPDAIVLDLMLPKMDGLAVCRELREKTPYIPILMLTAKDDVVDKVLGLEMGADDYITKPFSLRELEARIKSVMRRVRAAAHTETNEDAPIIRGRLRIDPAKREVAVGDRQVELTPKEFELLRLFASNPGRVFPRKYLLEKIWDYSYEGYDRTIDSHINRLRAKIEDNPENPQMVLTVWGIGYKFSDEQR
ncbi:MAG TPA: response regulator transcription factor [Pyrinomonadaceae bacterium]|jgi:DNA-binding response OmpR family regulator|nr:response regulator transcription factor [Pyrinomonadaceae bacterium]